MSVKKETIEEYLARGGTVKKAGIPDGENYYSFKGKYARNRLLLKYLQGNEPIRPYHGYTKNH